jgi:hypothetical protein
MLRIPRCLDSRVTDGSKVVSPVHQPCSTPQQRFLFYLGQKDYVILKKITSSGLRLMTFWQSGKGMKLTTHLYLVLKLKVKELHLHLPYIFMALCLIICACR